MAMPASDYWEQFEESEWQDFARRWLAEIRSDVSNDEAEIGQAVVSMNFTARPELQWQFILMAVSLAQSDDELGHIAAGPMEHLLGWHGEDYINPVEGQAATSAKFARALTGVWRNKMSDEVWSRVERLKAQVKEPLRPSASGDT
jgi:hypothetical protein